MGRLIRGYKRESGGPGLRVTIIRVQGEYIVIVSWKTKKEW